MTELIERTVDLDLDVSAVRELIGTSQGWQQWLADVAEVEVADGAEGRVVDGGIERHVRVHHAGETSVSFTWWEPHEPATVSHVAIDLVERSDGGTTVRITERLPSAASATARAAWEVRVCSLWACCVAAALV